MEVKIKKCKEAGCKNKISYKFRTGKADDLLFFKIYQCYPPSSVVFYLHFQSLEIRE